MEKCKYCDRHFVSLSHHYNACKEKRRVEDERLAAKARREGTVTNVYNVFTNCNNTVSINNINMIIENEKKQIIDGSNNAIERLLYSLNELLPSKNPVLYSGMSKVDGCRKFLIEGLNRLDPESQQIMKNLVSGTILVPEELDEKSADALVSVATDQYTMMKKQVSDLVKKIDPNITNPGVIIEDVLEPKSSA